VNAGFTKKELSLLHGLGTPPKIQDFLNKLPFNFEKKGETLRSPLLTLRYRSAHCFEGALLGAYVLSRHGRAPLIMYLSATDDDYDHVVALFKERSLWGAISKTNHAVLRYREPIYRTLRELAMSYFHEYFLDNGKKTLRRYSAALNLNRFGERWVTDEQDLWYIDRALDKTRHFQFAPVAAIKGLRRADAIERRAGKIKEW